jgi:hypothetical protein
MATAAMRVVGTLLAIGGVVLLFWIVRRVHRAFQPDPIARTGWSNSPSNPAPAPSSPSPALKRQDVYRPFPAQGRNPRIVFGEQPRNSKGPIPSAAALAGLHDAFVAFATQYFAMGGELARKIIIASARLNLARRRPAVGDKAIEGSICLEALLGDDRFDMTYKIGLRAALLTEQALKRRAATMRTIRDFYRMRSAVVHGSRDANSPNSTELVGAGIEIFVQVIRKLVEIGRSPDWPALELSAGALWEIPPA